MNRLGNRPNLLLAAQERWRPPLFKAPQTRGRRFAAWVRRLLDLQAGSIWRDLKRLLPECQGTVVDVGCGAQPYRSLLGPGAEYVGLDTADAQRHFGYDSPDTRYFSGETWPVADASADVVLATETLEHVAEPRKFLAEAYRCLKPGGRLILTVPFAARWHFIPHDYWRFTPSALGALLREAGFDELAVFARGNEVTVACYKTIALILPLLLPQQATGARALWRQACGVLLSPIVVLLAAVANVSLRGRGGEDCLGYTVLATRPARIPEAETLASRPSVESLFATI